MNKIRLTTAVAAAAAWAALSVVPSIAMASEGPWLVRARAVNLDPANKDSTPLNLSVNSKVIPEVDVSYFFTPSIAAELILTYPQKHTVRAGGADIGSLKHLPPTLTAQYHFTDFGAVKPYVGLGINFTRFSSVNLPGSYSIQNNSWGVACQVGVDYELSKGLYLNADLKKVQIRTDVSSAGSKVGTFKVDPLLFGVGVGYRF